MYALGSKNSKIPKISKLKGLKLNIYLSNTSINLFHVIIPRIRELAVDGT